MPTIVMYATRFCPYCMRARSLLQQKGVEYEEILVDSSTIRKTMEELSGQTSVPQIFINNHHIGGYDDMAALNRSGELDNLLTLN